MVFSPLPVLAVSNLNLEVRYHIFIKVIGCFVHDENPKLEYLFTEKKIMGRCLGYWTFPVPYFKIKMRLNF